MGDGWQPSYSLLAAEEIETFRELATRVFNHFIAPHYAIRGKYEFHDYLRPEEFDKRLESNHFIIGASDDNFLVGGIEFRRCEHICLLFVDGEYQGRGVGTGLIRQAVEHCRRLDCEPCSITVHSSPNSVEFYRSLGFYIQSPEETINGIRFTTMNLDVEDSTFLPEF